MKCTLCSILISLILITGTSHAESTRDFGQPKVAKRLVKILVADWCRYCRRLESWLKDEQIPYTRLDIEKDSEGKRVYNSIGRGPIPVTLIGNQTIRGANTELIREAYRKERLKYG